MEQRIYHGDITPEEVADHLVAQFDPRPDVQAQKIGQGSSFLVQLGGGDNPANIRRALTVALAPAPDGNGVMATIGQQNWVTKEQAGHAAFWTLLGAIITPWALMMLIWPIKDLVEDWHEFAPDRIWDAIGLYAASRGATLDRSVLLDHPHG